MHKYRLCLEIQQEEVFFLAGSDTDLKYVSTLSDTPLDYNLAT